MVTGAADWLSGTRIGSNSKSSDRGAVGCHKRLIEPALKIETTRQLTANEAIRSPYHSSEIAQEAHEAAG